MKKLAVLVFLGVTAWAQAQIVNIPDANFKSALRATLCVDRNGDGMLDDDADANNDGQIQVSEALAVTSITVPLAQITSLSGVEHFSNLKTLNCSNNKISSLALQGLTNLETLNCSYNELRFLDLEGLTRLETLSCFDNQLDYLLIGGLTNLKKLYCQRNQLKSLIVQDLINLNIIDCNSNEIADLDVQGLTNLETLNCYTNLITFLGIQGLTNLKDLNCSGNQLPILEIQGLTNLQALRCSGNLLTFLEVESLTNLQILYCGGNLLTSLSVQSLANLQELSCSQNKLTSLSVQTLFNLKKLNCSFNKLTLLEVQGLINLQELQCQSNQLGTLDLRHSSKLQQLNCTKNVLISLFIKNGAQETVEFGVNNPNLSYICCDEAQLGTLQAQVTSAGLTNCAVNPYCTFTPGGAFYTLQGEIKLDLENNGCDGNDATYLYQKLNITDGSTSGSLISNALGIYTAPLQAGVYTLMPILENPAYFTASPGTVQVTFPAPGNTLTQNFCISANGKHHDMEVSVLPIGPLRPGFEATYKIVYKNKGNQPESGSVSFNFDDNRMDFVSATQNPDNQATGVFTWNYTDLMPFETRFVSLTLRCNSPAQAPPVNGGDILTFHALVQGSQPDEMPVDNDFTLTETVVGSFDPNDKTCLEGNAITPEMVGQYVHYLIRFENTGTYAAENIVVKDVIDTTVFELASLQITDASHVVKTRIGHGNEVEFIFEDIQLPFAEATNDGYVAFKIKTKPTLVLGDSLKNKAEIYFDYNLPIVTNETHTTVQNPVVKAMDLGGLSLAIFPNPVRELLHFQGEVPIDRADIFDLSGKIIQSLQVSDQRVNVRALPNGPYWVKAYSSGKVYQTKMIKM